MTESLKDHERVDDHPDTPEFLKMKNNSYIFALKGCKQKEIKHSLFPDREV